MKHSRRSFDAAHRNVACLPKDTKPTKTGVNRPCARVPLTLEITIQRQNVFVSFSIPSIILALLSSVPAPLIVETQIRVHIVTPPPALRCSCNLHRENGLTLSSLVDSPRIVLYHCINNMSSIGWS